MWLSAVSVVKKARAFPKKLCRLNKYLTATHFYSGEAEAILLRMAITSLSITRLLLTLLMNMRKMSELPAFDRWLKAHIIHAVLRSCPCCLTRRDALKGRVQILLFTRTTLVDPAAWKWEILETIDICSRRTTEREWVYETTWVHNFS